MKTVMNSGFEDKPKRHWDRLKKVFEVNGHRLSAFGLPEPPDEPEAAAPVEEELYIADQLEYVARHEDQLTED